MGKLSRIFKEVDAMERERRKRCALVARKLLKSGRICVLVFLLIFSVTLPAASAESIWVKDTTDGKGDQVVAGSKYILNQMDPEQARAFIEIKVKYSINLYWWGREYVVPTKIDTRIYMNDGIYYLYTSSDRSGHGWISDAWSNPHDSWSVSGVSVGFGPYSVTLPAFYSVDNIMLNPTPDGHYSKTGDVKWYFQEYNLAMIIDSWMGSEKWFGGDQGYYFIGGEGTVVTYKFHTGVFYAYYTRDWLTGVIIYRDGNWVSKDIYAGANAGIRIGG